MYIISKYLQRKGIKMKVLLRKILLIISVVVITISVSRMSVCATQKWDNAYLKKFNSVKKNSPELCYIKVKMDKTKNPILILKKPIGGDKYWLYFYKYKKEKVEKIGKSKIVNYDYGAPGIKLGRQFGYSSNKGHLSKTYVFRLVKGKIKRDIYSEYYHESVGELFYKNNKKISKKKYVKVFNKRKELYWSNYFREDS